jgi:hypothetical protein
MDGTQRQVSEKYCALRTFELSLYLLLQNDVERKMTLFASTGKGVICRTGTPKCSHIEI